MAQARLSAGTLFLDDAGRVLMLHPTYKDYWDIPGGFVEPGEAPSAACAREIREELGISPPVGPLLVVDWAPTENDGDKVLYVFDGGSLSADDLRRIVFEDGEIDGYRYVEPSELESLAPARLVRRLHAAVIAKKSGRTIYTEHGREAPRLT
ncbi:NUDIX hydrolase [Rugosimonospora africana]|uniref:NUDIX hydrolase n=2 Tax=Rugosimonospora africana TaxID=556532 RepID=A0A8J3QVB8_9ACTN|nr:NUDIX hydrolase [Rugosimonospora africana]